MSVRDKVSEDSDVVRPLKLIADFSVDFPYGEVGRVAPFPRMTRTLAAGRIQPSG